jgi:hypothetical protein
MVTIDHPRQLTIARARPRTIRAAGVVAVPELVARIIDREPAQRTR